MTPSGTSTANRFRFRAWDGKEMRISPPLNEWDFEDCELFSGYAKTSTLMQSTGLTDSKGTEIFEGDIIEFTDKNEWYKCTWGPTFLFASAEERKQLRAEFDKLPTEKRVVKCDMSEGVNFSTYDLEQGRWQVIGNVHENPDLVSTPQ